MDHSELEGSFQNFTFKFIEPHEFNAAVKVLEDYLYVCMEPLGYKPEFEDDWSGFFLNMLNKRLDLSYMAVDNETGEIAAVRMVDLTKKDGPKDEGYKFQHKPIADSFQLCIDLCKDEDLFAKYGITEYPEMFGLCVADKYRQRGLASEMYTRGLNFMKKRGYKIVKCGFVSPYTRRAGYKHGYKEFASAKFLACRDSDGNVFNPKADPEGFICFGTFDLRN